jgi:hypothetical protein
VQAPARVREALAGIAPLPGSIATIADLCQLHLNKGTPAMRTHRALLASLALLAAPACVRPLETGTLEEQPFEFQVRSPTMAALQAAIDACPRGYNQRQRGCQIRLPSGTIRGHWTIGGDAGNTVQVGVCLIGQGPGHGSTLPGGKPGAAGTTLVYEGLKGGTLLDFAGGDYPCVRDVTLAMDGAAVGLRLRGGNTPIQNPMLERVTIAGDATKPAGIGLLITGPTNNDQVDALLADELKIDHVDVGIEVASNQALTNRIGPGSKIAAQSAAVRIRGGSLSLDGVLAQCMTENCCTYDLLPGHGYFRVRDGYHEIGLPAPDITLLCLSRDAPEGVGGWHMVSIVESYFNVQCDASKKPCFVDLIHGRSNVGVVFRDNWIASSQPDPKNIGRTFANVVFSTPAGAKSPARLVWEGNMVSSAMGGIQAKIGPNTRVEALTSDGSRIWNDTNLDGLWEKSEPAISVQP